MWLLLFADGFQIGSTLSGLNPGGGGPGFLLLLTAAGFGLLGRSQSVRGAQPARATLEAIPGALMAGLLLFLLAHYGLPSGIALEPITSGVIAAFFVPRVIAAVLAHAWANEAALVAS